MVNLKIMCAIGERVVDFNSSTDSIGLFWWHPVQSCLLNTATYAIKSQHYTLWMSSFKSNGPHPELKYCHSLNLPGEVRWLLACVSNSRNARLPSRSIGNQCPNKVLGVLQCWRCHFSCETQAVAAWCHESFHGSFFFRISCFGMMPLAKSQIGQFNSIQLNVTPLF